MTLAPDSGGWGHGPFGYTPFCEGPWVTLQSTPGYSHITEGGYDVTIHQFEDLTEKRILTNRHQRRKITWNFPPNDSATLGEVQSWFMAAGGQADRFVILDHEQGMECVVRFSDEPIERLRGPALVDRMRQITFDVEKELSYTDEIMKDEPVVYWRMNETTWSNSLVDGIGSVHLTPGGSNQVMQQPGPFPVESSVCIQASNYDSGVWWTHPGSINESDIRTRDMSWGFWFKTDATTGSALIYSRQNAGGTGGISTTVVSAQILVNWAGEVTFYIASGINDGLWHHLALVAHRTTSGHLVAYVDGSSWDIRSTENTSGDDLVSSLVTLIGPMNQMHIAEYAIFPQALSAERILAHYQAGVRKRS